MTEAAVDETGHQGPVGTTAVSRTIAAPLIHVWDVVVSKAGAEALLGPGADIGTKGQSWRSDDGPFGVVRTLHPLEQIRVSWHENENSPRSLVDIGLSADGDHTRVDLQHEPVHRDGDSDHEHWSAALARLEAVALG